MKKFTLYSVFIPLSVAGHLFTFALLTYYFHVYLPHENTLRYEDKLAIELRTIILKTYIENPVINSAAANNKAMISQSVLNQLAIQKTPIKKVTPQTKKIHSNKTPITHTTIKKNDHRKIERILRMLIAEQQFYPEIAAARHQTGAVRIHFRLKADGYVADVKILKSSGFSTLDAAALQIIQAISPAKAALPLLKSDDDFEIEMIF